MKKSKWLVAMVIGAAALTSNMANAAVKSIETSQSVLVNFLSASSWLDFAVFMAKGDTFSTSQSGNIVFSNDVTFNWHNATITYGSATPDDGSYGWLKFTPNAGKTMGFSWAGDGITVSPVPEPEVLALLGVGVAGLLLARRRQKNQPTLAL